MNERKREKRAFLMSFSGNVLLFVVKLVTGFIACSELLKADAVHSLTDVVVTVVCFFGDALAKRKKGEKFKYGYVKIANFTALASSVALILTAVLLFCSGENQTSGGGEILTISVCVFSIIVKQVLFYVVLKTARKSRSEILKADAWHHQADSLSSIAALVGSLFIAASFFVGEFVCRLILSALIAIVAVKIFVSAFLTLIDYYAGRQVEQSIIDFVLNIDGVSSCRVRTRRGGNGCFVVIYAQVSVCDVSALRELFCKIKKKVEARFPFVYEAEVTVL